jgi:hypothetical protein
VAGGLAEAFRWLAEHPAEGRKWGQSGKQAAERITWDAVIDRLLAQ